MAQQILEAIFWAEVSGLVRPPLMTNHWNPALNPPLLALVSESHLLVQRSSLPSHRNLCLCLEALPENLVHLRHLDILPLLLQDGLLVQVGYFSLVPINHHLPLQGHPSAVCAGLDFSAVQVMNFVSNWKKKLVTTDQYQWRIYWKKNCSTRQSIDTLNCPSKSQKTMKWTFVTTEECHTLWSVGDNFFWNLLPRHHECTQFGIGFPCTQELKIWPLLNYLNDQGLI